MRIICLLEKDQLIKDKDHYNKNLAKIEQRIFKSTDRYWIGRTEVCSIASSLRHGISQSGIDK